jgi:hypothetical protein
MKPVTRDPHLDRIRRGLAAHLDAAVFERCLGDLLRPDLPGLVPVTGGGDGGWDGAFIEENHGQCPLIVTSGEDYVRNLKKSLEALRNKPFSPSRAAFATSQEVTPPSRQRLNELARDQGFELVQIFDREAIVDRLYHSSRWTQELLSIAGVPSVLGSVPPARRQQAGLELLGRDEDLAWLRGIPAGADRLLIGEPGSGKTYLLAHEVAAGRLDALFLLRRDAAESDLANALRDQQPSFVIVDDAHVDLGVLDRLRGLRDEAVHAFGILATTWPGRENDVRQALGPLARQAERKLELLPRRDIVAIFRALGVAGLHSDSEHVLHELANQAANRPGLAVTLGSLWMAGSPEDRERLWRGDDLRDHVLGTLRHLIGEDVSALLASLALGDERGCRLEDAADFLGIPLAKAYEMVTGIALAGLLATVGPYLKVQPRALRAALVAQVFFPAAPRPLLDCRPLLARLPEKERALFPLVQAAVFEAPVPRDLLRELASASREVSAWNALARVDRAEATWVLANYPGAVGDIAESTLAEAPRETLDRLLAAATAESDPAKLLQPALAWISQTDSPIFDRRSIAVASALDFMAHEGAPQVAWTLLLATLRPELWGGGPTADGSGIFSQMGFLGSNSVVHLRRLWRRLRGVIRSLPRDSFQQLEQSLEWYCQPWPVQACTKEDLHHWQGLAKEILEDLEAVELPLGPRAILNEIRGRLGLPKTRQVPLGFEVLFTEAGHDESEPEYEAKRNQVLAELRKRPEQSISDLIEWQDGAEGTALVSRVPEALAELGQGVAEPEVWLEVLRGKPVPPQWIFPFTERLAVTRPPGWTHLLGELLEVEWCSAAAAWTILQLPDAPEDLSEKAIVTAREFPTMVERLVERKQLPQPLVLRFLETPGPLAAQIAIARWERPSGEIPPELRAAWLSALLAEPPRNDYRYREILRSDQELARRWLELNLWREGSPFPDFRLMRSAIAALDDETRALFIDQFQRRSQPRDSEVLVLLVGRNPGLYRQVVTGSFTRYLKALPLRGTRDALDSEPVLDSDWRRMVEVALEGDLEPDELLRGVLSGPSSYAGFGVEYWTRWQKAFEAWASDLDPRVRELASLGVGRARNQIERARREEREAALAQSS